MPNALIETSSLVPEIAMGHVIAHQNNAFRAGWLCCTLSSHRRFGGIALHGIEDAQHPYSLKGVLSVLPIQGADYAWSITGDKPGRLVNLHWNSVYKHYGQLGFRSMQTGTWRRCFISRLLLQDQPLELYLHYILVVCSQLLRVSLITLVYQQHSASL